VTLDLDSIWHRKGFEADDKRCNGWKNRGSCLHTHKDRLCRFGYELIEMVFKKFNVSLIILQSAKDSTTDTQDYQQELAEDLLAVVNVFVAKNNGKRSSENRKRRKEELEEDRLVKKKVKK